MTDRKYGEPVKPLTWQDYEEIADALIALNNLLFALNMSDSEKIDKWNHIRERVNVAGYKLKTMELKHKR